jgi:DNA-binding Lrp family transcriptional regulator
MGTLNVFVTIVGEEKAETNKLVEELLGMEGVTEAFELSGGLDILLRVTSDSLSEMNRTMETIRAMDGVKSADTYLILGRKS